VSLAGNDTIGNLLGTGDSAQFGAPLSLTVDSNGVVYTADANNHVIKKITQQGTVSVIAGHVPSGSADGFGPNANFYYPMGLVVDSLNNIFIGEDGNHKIRKITFVKP